MGTMTVFFLRYRQLAKCVAVIVVGLLVLVHVRSWFGEEETGGRRLAARRDAWSEPAGRPTGDSALHTPDMKEVRRSLTTKDGEFVLEGRKLNILSGAMHYFRVVPEYWKDRLIKMKAAGLNTLETYVAWNLHEAQKGTFDFDGILNIKKYIELARDVGLYVIVRPGPYICAEWDMGGLPAWLLRDPDMESRSTYTPYLNAVRRYIHKLADQIAHLQYRYGGPILAFQVENEYGSYGMNKHYLRSLEQIFLKADLKELHFTSDSDRGMERGSLAGLLTTGNFNELRKGRLIVDYLRKQQPSMPVMTMEFWPGWFDTWGTHHHSMKVEDMEAVLRFILREEGNVNFYMFHGGTNFGFMSGANMPFITQITSYDYDAPISEYGYMTNKFMKVRQMMQNFTQATLPPLPPQPTVVSYGEIKITEYISLTKMTNILQPVMSENLINMENLDINDGSGQNHGFILYKTMVDKLGKLEFHGQVRDRLQIMIDGRETAVFDRHSKLVSIELSQAVPQSKKDVMIDLLVENMGRVNYGHINAHILDHQRKGLLGELQLNLKAVQQYQIYPLDFKAEQLDRILAERASWWKFTNVTPNGELMEPGLFHGVFHIGGQPQDTFLHMQDWVKGVVFINNFNLGRYWRIGPQQTLYVPAPLLRRGPNDICVFELHRAPVTGLVPSLSKPVLDYVRPQLRTPLH